MYLVTFCYPFKSPSSVSIPLHSELHFLLNLSLSLVISIAPLKSSSGFSKRRSCKATMKMSRAAVELDFFGLEKEKSSSSASVAVASKSLHQRRSSRGIQNTISRINPELLKSVIASTSFSAPPTPTVELNALPPLPVYVAVPRPATTAAIDGKVDAAPLTIFYNGTVSVFDISPDKAEDILKFVAEVGSNITDAENKNASSHSSDHQQFLGTLGGDLPLFRRMSLQRFLEKRKERLTSMSPYAFDNYNERAFGKKTIAGGNFHF